MDLYLLLKWLHVISATLLFGTGLGSAFYMWRAYRGGGSAVLAAVAREVVRADWIFTTPAVVLQPLSGLGLAATAGYTFDQLWLWLSLALYVAVGVFWIPVVFIQIRVRDLAATAAPGPLPVSVHRLMGWWYRLGWPAFLLVIAIMGLMIWRPV